jgi:hypothetical protein
VNGYVFALQLGLKLLDLALLGILDSLRLAIALEGSVAVLEELLLPAIEEIGTNVQLITELGDRRLLEKRAFENGDFLGTGKIATRLVHGKPPPRPC